ncbi:MAG: helix-turn-helix domain-containing protein [Lachnospiraceae bacterium]
MKTSCFRHSQSTDTPSSSTMTEKGVTQYQLLKNKVLDNKTLDSLKKNKNITLLTLERLCNALDCTPNDIVAFHKEK